MGAALPLIGAGAGFMVGGPFGAMAGASMGSSLATSMSPKMPPPPAAPAAPPPPPSFGDQNISTAALEARKRVASLAGGATVATSPGGIASPASTSKPLLGG